MPLIINAKQIRNIPAEITYKKKTTRINQINLFTEPYLDRTCMYGK